MLYICYVDFHKDRINVVTGLAIFHCTLLSLRGHDDGKPVTHIQDHELAGEEEVFGG